MENIDTLKEKIEFHEWLIQKYVVNGTQQYQSLFQDWRKKQGLARDR